MHNRQAILILLICFFATTASAETHLSIDTVQAWWKTKSSEEMTVDGDLMKIHLRNKEVAYLLPVGFYERGRNFINHIVMIRPSLKEVREVDDPVSRDIEVLDLNHDGVSEVVAVALGSGQGTTRGEKAIVQFNGWLPIVVHKADFEDNEGEWGTEDARFYSNAVNWQFIDLNADGITDLVEKITTQKGRNNRSPVSKNTTYKYLFKGNAFERYADNRK